MLAASSCGKKTINLIPGSRAVVGTHGGELDVVLVVLVVVPQPTPHHLPCDTHARESVRAEGPPRPKFEVQRVDPRLEVDLRSSRAGGPFGPRAATACYEAARSSERLLD